MTTRAADANRQPPHRIPARSAAVVIAPPPVYRVAAVSAQRKQSAAAPPVYRPARSPIAAPPIYQPNVPARVQRKSGASAPAVYRPGSTRVASPPVYRPGNAPLAPPPVYRPGVAAPLQTKPATFAPVQPRNGEGAIQRLVNWAGLTKTKTEGFYAVDRSAPSTLYGRQDAPPPVPKGLYVEEKDKDEKGETVLKWTPNVRFITRAQKDVLLENEKGLGYFAKWDLSRRQSNTLKQIANLESEIRQTVSATGMTTGVLGPNDCRGWATQLRDLVAESLKLTVEATGPSVPFDLTTDEKAPVLGVGDTMVQSLGVGSSCGYHAATVVAKDTKSVITLEAHAAKEIDRPEFHIHEGLEGFIEGNNEGEKYLEENGKKGQIYNVTSSGKEAIQNREKQRQLEEIYQQEKADPQAILRQLAAFKLIEKRL